jgi:hypothetical protein
MFENRVLRGISGPKREEVAGRLRKLHNEELGNIIAVIQSRGLNECDMREMCSMYKVTIRSLKGRHNFGRLCIDGRRGKSVPVTGREGP